MTADRLRVLPKPQRVRLRRGHLDAAEVKTVQWAGVRTPRLERAVMRFDTTVQRIAAVGFPFRIDCRNAARSYPALGDDESYRVDIDGDGVAIFANEEWGALRALTTVQLLLRGAGAALRLPRLSVEDAPRFSWRGLMLDPARHFLSPAAIERTLDAMALVKLNVLHLHLSDDQGFRFAGAAFPELALAASDDFYTVAELQHLVEQAADRGIRVVPEIDMPGHCASWLAAHPEWTPVAEAAPPSTRFGVHKACLDPTRDVVYESLARLLADVAQTFPDEYLHIGGDEVHPAWWHESEAVQGYMRAIGARDVTALQAHFNARIGRIVAGLDRRMIGWDEIIHPDLPAVTAVQSWRGAASRDRALAHGFDCVFSAGYYLDLFYPADIHYAFDPEATPERLAGTEAGLRSDPRLAHVRDGLGWATSFNAAATTVAPLREAPAVRPGRVLGGEACLWGELVGEHLLELRLWERLPAVAERLWSAADCTDVTGLRWRLGGTTRALASFCGIDLGAQRSALLADLGMSSKDRRQLAPLLDALESIKWYARLLGSQALRDRVAGRPATAARPYDTTTPLRRVVDALSVESPAALKVAELVRRLLHDPDDGAARRALTSLSNHWRTQSERFERVVRRVPAITELSMCAAALAELGTLLERRLAGTTTAADAERLAALSAPRGEYVLAVAVALQPLFRPAP
jgi:hexosaminidase